MSQPESKLSFFRQSGWMVIATFASGVFMTLVHTVVSARMAESEYAMFVVLLRCLILMNVPAGGLQTVFAQQSAAAIDEERTRRLSTTTRVVAAAIFFIWLGIVIAALIAHDRIATTLRITNSAAFWLTVGVALTSLWQPMAKGILQGKQNFMGLGWVMILDGVGRFLSVCFIVMALGGQAGGAMAAALSGQILSIIAGITWCWKVCSGPGARIDWKPWLKQVIPLTIGSGAVVVLSNSDIVYVQSVFPGEQPKFYIAGAMIGFALAQFTLPLAIVMFPKLVSSAAKAQKTDALKLTLISTSVVGGLAVLLSVVLVHCEAPLLRELPLRVLYAKAPQYWSAAPLVPWFLGCMLLSSMANVLINALLAREKFAIVPWLAALSLGFLFVLGKAKTQLLGMEMFAAFKLVVLILGAFNAVLLALAIWFVWGQRQSSRPENEAAAQLPA